MAHKIKTWSKYCAKNNLTVLYCINHLYRYKFTSLRGIIIHQQKDKEISKLCKVCFLHIRFTNPTNGKNRANHDLRGEKIPMPPEGHLLKCMWDVTAN